MMVRLSTCPLLSFHNLGPWKRFTRSFDSTGKSHHWHTAIMFTVNNLEAANVPKDLWQTILALDTSYTPKCNGQTKSPYPWADFQVNHVKLQGCSWSTSTCRGSKIRVPTDLSKCFEPTDLEHAANVSHEFEKNGRIGASHTLRLA